MPHSRTAIGNAKIEILPDDILLEIFDCHRSVARDDASSGPWKWHRLAHVSQRWRRLVFASPRRLDLQLVYTYKNPVRKTLDFWPDLPIAISYPSSYRRLAPEDENNVIIALKHSERICELDLSISRTLWPKSDLSMRAQFPALERLRLRSQDKIRPLILPEQFLGGCTPRLRDIHMASIAFPTLPMRLMSSEALVSLHLDEIPTSGYFSPEALADGLSVTTQLETLKIHFLPPNSHERSIDTLPQTRVALPVLTELEFKGNSEYIEDLVSRIDTPTLGQLSISFFEQPTFGIPRLSRYIGRTKELKSPCHTSVHLSEEELIVTHYSRSTSTSGNFKLQILCDELDRQVPLLIHVSRQLSDLVSDVERLSIEAYPQLSSWLEREEMDSAQWLELFRPFRGVKRFDVTGSLVQSITLALEPVTGEMARIVLPALRDLYLIDYKISPTSIEQFIDARELYGRPVSVHYELPCEDD
jgi:F-box-like